MTDGNNDNKPHNSSSLSCTPDHVICPRSHLLPLLLLFLILFVIYFNSFKGAWIFDDYHNIVDNKYVHLQSLDWSSIKETFYGVQDNKISRPLSYLSFGLNYYFHELNTFGYHLVNFIIHCTTALFLYLFIFQVLRLPILNGRFTNRAGSIALLATTLWAINPIQVTAVTVIVQRMASMSGMFFIMAMFFYLMGRTTQEMRKKITWFSLCILSGVSALASKENAVMLPIVLYIFDLLLIQGVSRENIKRQILIAFIPLAIIGALTFVLTNPSTFLSGYDSEYKLLDRLLTQPRVLLFYLSLMIYPIADRLTLIYDIPLSTSLLSPWTTTPSICFWLVWIGLGLYLAGKRPLFSFCLLFFVVNHFVESSFIPLELVFEHRNYIPSMMLFCLAGVGIITFINYFSNKRLLTCLVFIFLTIFIIAQSHTVFQRNYLFENPLFLWSDNVLKSPGLSRPYTYLGNVYWELGRYEDAKKAALSSIVGKYSRRHLQAVPLSNLANYYIYIQPSNPTNALNLYEQALRVAPEYWPARFGMATALLFLGQLDNARIQLEKTLAVAPRHRNVLLLYSLVLLKQNDFSSAFNQAKMALATDASPSLAYKVIGEVYRERKEYKQALGYWKRYSEANPTDIESLFARMYLSERMGDESELRKTAIETLLLKGNRTWDEFFKQIEFQSKTDIQIFSIEPHQARQLIQTALKKEIIKTMER